VLLPNKIIIVNMMVIAISGRFFFIINDIAVRAPHVEITSFYLVKVIINLVVVAYKRCCNGKIMVRKGEIKEVWLMFRARLW
jgi:hypothetical protein